MELIHEVKMYGAYCKRCPVRFEVPRSLELAIRLSREHILADEGANLDHVLVIVEETQVGRNIG